MYLVGMLVLLFLANVAMLMGMTNWPQRTREGFAEHMMKEEKEEKGMKGMETMDNISPYGGLHWASRMLPQPGYFGPQVAKEKEKFMNYLEPGTYRTAAIGPYDDIDMAAGIPADGQGFRMNMPNEPKIYSKYGRKDSSMLPFEENQCKPECCSSTMSCNGGGCVCTTPEDRDLINTRGGNRLNRKTHKTGPGYYDEDM